MREIADVDTGSEFGARLRQAILERFGPNQEREFARRIGMDPTQLSRTLNGKVGKRPEHETLQRYAEGLGVPFSVVLGWTLPDEEGESSPARSSADSDPLSDVMEWLRQQPDIVADFADAKRRMTPAVYAEYVRQTATAWASNARMQKRTWELAEQARATTKAT